MEIQFANPGFLAGLAALAVPVLLHLLRAPEARRLVFPAAWLLAGTSDVLARRTKFEERFLLLLRLGAMLFFVLLLARPRLRVEALGLSQPAGEPRVALYVLDDTPSMAARVRPGAPAETRFALALRRIEADLGRLGPGGAGGAGSAGFLTASGRECAPTADLARFRRELAALEVSARAAPMAEALRAGARRLAGERMAARELVVVSDFAASSWEGLAEGLERERKALAALGVRVLDVGGETPNAGLVALGSSPAEIAPRLPFAVRAAVAAWGLAGRRTVTLRLDGATVGTREVELLPGGTVQVEFAGLALEGPGARGASVALSGGEDAFPDDDARALALTAAPARQVLVVGPEDPEASRREGLRFLRGALAPPGGPYRELAVVRVVSGRELEALPDASTADAAVLFGAPELSPRAAARLSALVESGRGLVVFPALSGGAPAIPGALAGLLPGRVEGIREPSAPVRLRLARDEHPFLAAFRGGENLGAEGVPFRRVAALAPAAGVGARVLASFVAPGVGAPSPRPSPGGRGGGSEGGMAGEPPAILERTVDRAPVLLAGFGLSLDSSDLARDPAAFAPLLQELVRHAATAGADRRGPPRPAGWFLPGETVVWELAPSDRGASAWVRRPPGPGGIGGPAAREALALPAGASAVVFEGATRPGVYVLSVERPGGSPGGLSGGDAREHGFAVGTDPTESDPTRLAAGDLERLAGPGGASAPGPAAPRQGAELTLLLWVLATLLFLAEGGLAAAIARKRPAAEASAAPPAAPAEGR